MVSTVLMGLELLGGEDRLDELGPEPQELLSMPSPVHELTGTVYVPVYMRSGVLILSW